MAARMVVVVVIKRPVDRLGKVGRDGDCQRTTRLQYPDELPDSLILILDVLQNLRADNLVEGGILEWQI